MAVRAEAPVFSGGGAHVRGTTSGGEACAGGPASDGCERERCRERWRHAGGTVSDGGEQAPNSSHGGGGRTAMEADGDGWGSDEYE